MIFLDIFCLIGPLCDCTELGNESEKNSRLNHAYESFVNILCFFQAFLQWVVKPRALL